MENRGLFLHKSDFLAAESGSEKLFLKFDLLLELSFIAMILISSTDVRKRIVASVVKSLARMKVLPGCPLIFLQCVIIFIILTWQL